MAFFLPYCCVTKATRKIREKDEQGSDKWRVGSLKGPSFAATDEARGQFLWFGRIATSQIQNMKYKHRYKIQNTNTNTYTKYKIQHKCKIEKKHKYKCISAIWSLWTTPICVDFSRICHVLCSDKLGRCDSHFRNLKTLPTH